MTTSNEMRTSRFVLCTRVPCSVKQLSAWASCRASYTRRKLLMRWLDLSRSRKLEIAGRVGADEWEIRADLEAVGGAGLGYL